MGVREFSLFLAPLWERIKERGYSLILIKPFAAA